MIQKLMKIFGKSDYLSHPTNLVTAYDQHESVLRVYHFEGIEELLKSIPFIKSFEKIHDYAVRQDIISCTLNSHKVNTNWLKQFSNPNLNLNKTVVKDVEVYTEKYTSYWDLDLIIKTPSGYVKPELTNLALNNIHHLFNSIYNKASVVIIKADTVEEGLDKVFSLFTIKPKVDEILLRNTIADTLFTLPGITKAYRLTSRTNKVKIEADDIFKKYDITTSNLPVFLIQDTKTVLNKIRKFKEKYNTTQFERYQVVVEDVDSFIKQLEDLEIPYELMSKLEESVTLYTQSTKNTITYKQDITYLYGSMPLAVKRYLERVKGHTVIEKPKKKSILALDNIKEFNMFDFAKEVNIQVHTITHGLSYLVIKNLSEFDIPDTPDLILYEKDLKEKYSEVMTFIDDEFIQTVVRSKYPVIANLLSKPLTKYILEDFNDTT